MTFWPLTNSDISTNQTFHQFHDLDTDFDLHRITSGFHGAFATGVACQQGTLTTPDTWFRPLFGGLHVLWLLRPLSPTLHSFNDLPKLTFSELRGFHGAFATGVACQQGALTLPDTWFLPLFGDLLMLQLLRPNSSNLPCFTRLFTSNTPWYFLDFALCTTFLWPLRSGWLSVLSLYKEDYLQIFKCVSFWLHSCCG